MGNNKKKKGRDPSFISQRNRHLYRSRRVLFLLSVAAFVMNVLIAAEGSDGMGNINPELVVLPCLLAAI